MFKVINDKIGEFDKIILLDNSNLQSVEILPGLGACINSLKMVKNGTIHEIIKSPANFDEFLLQYPIKFNNAKLFPFANRINQANYEFEGKIYKLPINEKALGHAIHGLVSDKEFVLTKSVANEKKAECTFEYSFHSFVNGYPFDFLLSTTYELSKKGLKCITKVINLSDGNMPMSDGWHPYFSTGSSADELFIKIPSENILDRSLDFIPNGKMLKNDKFKNFQKIGNTRFNDCFILESDENIAETVIYDAVKDLKIKIWQQTGDKKYNFIQCYIPPDRKSIAIEPMTAAPDAFNNKMGLIILKKNENLELSFGVEIE